MAVSQPKAREEDRHRPEPGEPAVIRSVLGHPATLVAVLLAMVLLMSWQFITDASRAVPAFDTAFYQWRAEFLRAAEPGTLIELRGAQGSLAGGYRIAEPVLGALMQGVGGVAPVTHTVVLSVLFRLLPAVGLAAFAWRHRRSWLLFYVTLLTVPALFLLQRFFGFMDNFFTLSLLAGVLLLLEPMRTSWPARIAATAFLFVGGLSHPTTVAIFLLSMGAVAVYRLIRERSLRAVLRSEGPIIGAGTAAALLIVAFWLGGPWGPASSFSDAAVPPPETVSYFLNRSAGVLRNLQPFHQATAPGALVVAGVAAMIGLFLAGLVHAVSRAWRNEHFAEVSVAWTLPLAGMFGFLLEAAYPYFRFFNATLAPLLLIALGMVLVIRWPLGARGRRAVPAAAAAVVAALLAGWWFRGLTEWNSTPTWLTPEVRTTMAAARAYLEAKAPGTRAIFVTDAVPGQIVPYGKYKEFANATFAGLGGDHIDDTVVYFGDIEDFLAQRASRSSVPDPAYDDLAADSARQAFRVLERSEVEVVIFFPVQFNEFSDNPRFVEGCPETRCVRLTESGLYVLDPVEVAAAPISDGAVSAARRAAHEARQFAADPPGPLQSLGSSLLSLLRLGLLFLVPGWLFARTLPSRSWPETLALVPILSIPSVTVVGAVVLAVARDPMGGGMAWAVWAITVALGLAAAWASGVFRRRGVGRDRHPGGKPEGSSS